MVLQVMLGHAAKFLLFVLVESFFRSPECSSGSLPDLNKNQHASIAHDQIDLASTDVVVAANEFHTLALKIVARRVFRPVGVISS